MAIDGRAASRLKKTIPLVILAIIILLAFALRAYHFHDLIRFNNDQVRDAVIIDHMISETEIPLLGPKAGGTGFNLGPAFYYIEYIPAALFGNSPDTLASLSVLLFLLSMPIFFIMTRRLLGIPVALATTFIYAISFFGVKYSRFTWNPNLLPFFTLATLFCLYQSTRYDGERPPRTLWTIATGILVGISIQLHTILLIALPATLLVSVAVTLKKKTFRFGQFAIMLGMIFLFNTPQIVSEWQTHGENTTAFFKGLSSKTGSDQASNNQGAIRPAATCFVQGNLAVLSGIGFSDDCDLLSKKFRILPTFWPTLILGLIFSIGGTLLALRAWFKESDPKRKYLLGLLLSYSLFAVALLIPLGKEVSLRFFVAVFFSPFLLFGFWLKLFIDKSCVVGYGLLALSLLILGITNYKLYSETYLTVGDSKYYGGTPLGDIDPVAKYIANDILSENNPNGNYFILEYEAGKATAYIATRYGATTVTVISWGVLRDNLISMQPAAIYAVDDIAPEKKPRTPEEKFPELNIIRKERIGAYDIIKMTPKD